MLLLSFARYQTETELQLLGIAKMNQSKHRSIIKASDQHRADAFDQLRNNKYPVDPNFRWVCMDTRVLTAGEMKTSHLFNALKMIWNHNVPEECMIQPHTEYRGARNWPKGHRKFAITNLYNELMNRVDRTVGMNTALATMQEHLRKWGDKMLEDKK